MNATPLEKIEPRKETKEWLYDVITFRGGDRLFPFVKNLPPEELYQLHCLLNHAIREAKMSQLSHGEKAEFLAAGY